MPARKTAELPPDRLVTELLDQLLDGEDLTLERSAQMLERIMEGRVSQVQTAALLIALRAKGETASELAGLATAMRRFATPVATKATTLLDTAGTGGGYATFNVSTTAALIAAAAGCKVAKHGNRSATSKSGSADLLEALGVNLELTPKAVADCIDQIGFGFMFAPLHHPATRYVVPVRKALAVRTVFNLLGPLTNPAAAGRQLVGVSQRAMQDRVAEALSKLGVERALVVNSDDGLDELSVCAPTRVLELRNGTIQELSVNPADLGLGTHSLEQVAGGDPVLNAEYTRAIFAGDSGARRDLALINAGAAIYVAGAVDRLQDGVGLAAETVDSGKAQELLERFVAFTNGFVTDQ